MATCATCAVAAATTLRVFKADGERGEAVRVKATREPARALPPGPIASAKPSGKPGAKAPPLPGQRNYFGICHRTRLE